MAGERVVTGGRAAMVAGLYFLSGLTGLVYEVTFNKYLSYVFGATAYASSAVLVAFMGGLSAGGVLIARFNARLSRRFFFYGTAEMLVGAFCAVSPWLFAGIGGVYVGAARVLPASLPALAMLRWFLATAVVFLPAAGMGATLPLLAPAVASRGESKWLSLLYALNVLGGAAGSLLAAYLVLPSLGLAATLRMAALLNFAIGGAAMLLGRSKGVIEHDARKAHNDAHVATLQGASTAEQNADAHVATLQGASTAERVHAHVATRTGLSRRDLFALSFGSGVLVFAAEVVFVHMLALVIGTSVYAFGLMLAIFLVCLGAGAAIAPGLARRNASAGSIAAAIAGLALAASVPIWDHLPELFDRMAPYATTWAARETGRGLVAFVAIGLPATAMGALFPIVLGALGMRDDLRACDGLGAEVGRMTALNTVGSIVGSVVGGFVLLPRWGSQTSLLAIALGYALLAAATGGRFVANVAGIALPAESAMNRASAASLRGRRVALALGVATAAVVFFSPRWDLVKLTSGANVYFESGPEPDSIEMVREDVHGGVTTVVHAGGLLTLYTNGKFQGNNGYELEAQRAFAHIPCLLTERHERAFTIGLGTGTTAGTLAAYPFSRIDVAEISPAIAYAAGKYFSDINGGVLGDPRLHLSHEDGRNALLVSDTTYDLIGIEISSIWFAGAANLYSREFYETVRARLTPGGVLQQWVQFHHMGRRELAAILATVRASFPHVALYAHGNQGVIVAGARPLVMSRARADELFANPRIAALFDEGASLADLASNLLVVDDAIDRFVDDSAKEAQISRAALISTDDNLYLEYATPKNNVVGMPSIEQTIDMVARYGRADLASGTAR